MSQDYHGGTASWPVGGFDPFPKDKKIAINIKTGQWGGTVDVSLLDAALAHSIKIGEPIPEWTKDYAVMTVEYWRSGAWRAGSA